MKSQFERTAMLIGEENVDKLSKMKIIIFGIGGVGGYVVEALARSGVGSFVLVDHDVVSESNINRQIIATTNTVGKKKIDVMKERILSINKEANVETKDIFYLPETRNVFNFEEYDYIVDAIDTITAKLDIIERANELNIPIISAMGAGNKLDPTRFEVSDIYKTSVCPLAKVMRRELKKRNVKHLKVVYSKEEPIKNNRIERIPGSIAFVPSVVGLIIASEVIKDVIK